MFMDMRKVAWPTNQRESSNESGAIYFFIIVLLLFSFWCPQPTAMTVGYSKLKIIGGLHCAVMTFLFAEITIYYNI